MLEAALGYARAGWAIFPCQEGSNVPSTRHGFKDATCDEDQIREWWGEWPQANIGMPGQNGFFIVDIDGAEALAAMQALVDFPDTLVFQTPRGDGYHIVLRGEVYSNYNQRLPPNVDIRGINSGYIVVTPSIRTDKGYGGRGYLRLSGSWDSIADAPSDLLELLERPERPEGSCGTNFWWLPTHVRAYEAGQWLSGIPADETNRNTQTSRIGFMLWDWYYLDSDSLWDLLWAWNATRDNPLGAEEMERIIGSIMRSGDQTGDHLIGLWYRWITRKRPIHPLMVEDDSEVVAAAVEDKWLEEKAYETMSAGDCSKNDIEEFRQAILAAKGAAAACAMAERGEFVPALSKVDDAELANQLAQAWQGDDDEPVCVEWSLLHTYRGGLWRPVRDSQLSTTLQSWSDNNLWYQPPDRKGMQMFRLGGRTVKSVTGLVKDRCEQWGRQAGWLEAGRGLAFADCFLTVEGQEMVVRDVCADNKATFGYDFALDLDASCPRFERYLETIWDGKPDRAARVALLQEFTGAALLGVAPLFQRALILHGGKGTGKSTFLDVISALFKPEGLDAVAAVEPQNFDDPNQIGRLVGVRLNAVYEVSDKPILGIDALKQVVDGSRMSVNTKYKAVYDVIPQAAHIFATNDLPQAPGAHPSLWDRFIVLSMDRHFRHTPDQILGLGTQIVTDEMQGVTAWAVRGLKRLLKNQAYTLPASSIAKMAEWQRTSCSVGLFYNEMCRDAEPKNGTPLRVLFTTYQVWAIKSGYKPVSMTQFGRRSEHLGYEKEKLPSGVRVRPVALLKKGAFEAR